MKLIIWLAKFFNLIYYHGRHFFETLGFKTGWAEKVGRYYHLPESEVSAIYEKKRIETVKLWGEKQRSSEKQIHSFYKETDYFVFRQNYFHRLKIYLDLALPLFLKKKGKFCEYGGGIGPFSDWLLPLFPDWQYHIADLDCPMLAFAKWRFKNKDNVSFSTVTLTKLPLKDQYDVITCKQVLEHVSQPLRVIKHLVAHLKPGGWLYLDYIYALGEENLITGAKQRKQVLAYLRTKLKPLFSIDPQRPEEGYGLYLKSNGNRD